MAADPSNVGDGVVQVVEEHLADAGPPLRAFGHEVGQPTVVGPDAGQAVAVVLGRGGRGEQHEAREEGGDGVGEQDLGHHPVALLVVPPPAAVPIADLQIGVLEVLVRVAVLVPPGIEVGVELGIQVVPVLGVAAAGVGIGRDDRVVLGHF